MKTIFTVILFNIDTPIKLSLKLCLTSLNWLYLRLQIVILVLKQNAAIFIVIIVTTCLSIIMVYVSILKSQQKFTFWEKNLLRSPTLKGHHCATLVTNQRSVSGPVDDFDVRFYSAISVWSTSATQAEITAPISYSTTKICHEFNIVCISF